MGEFKPHPYQCEAIKNIIDKFKEHDRIVFQLDTGGGKTVCFSFLSKYWADKHKQKVLILCHREELVQQACETLVKAGLTFETITPSTKRLNHQSDVYVAMIETLDRRLKKNAKYLFNVGLVVADESHVQIFNKVYDYFPDAKILGVTATPVLLGRETFYRCVRCNTEHPEIVECCNTEVMEWTRPKVMSRVYQDIVVGTSIDFLINFGQLVREINFVKDYIDTDSLSIDASGEFSNKEQDEAFGSDNSLFNVVLNYEELCRGKRTIIFNNSAKTNLKVYQQLKEKGYNVKLFDSVNDTEVSRKQLVKWFKDNDDSILCNVGVFVAGFDVKEVQAIILNVATTSLSRYLQMVGRGGRATDKIYKDNFIVVDGGGNVNRFNAWSDNTRNWHSIFFNGVGKEKPKKELVDQIKECDNCGYYMSRTATECPECGTITVTKKREKTEGDSIARPLDKIPLPNGEKIYRYTVSQGENIHFAHKILINQIIDLFIFHQVSKELYEKTKNNGKLDEKISKMIRSCFFVLMAKKDIQSGSNRTLKYLKDKTKERLEKYYGDK